MDAPRNNDFSIRSIPQMGGTSTTQQAIYNVHRVGCGINKFLLNTIGTTNLTYIDLLTILRDALNNPSVLESFDEVIEAFLQVQQDPTDQKEYRLYQRYYEYGQAVWAILSLFTVDGYTTTCTVYDEDGRTFFESARKEWFPVYDVGGGVLAPVQLILVPQIISFPGPLGTFRLNPTGRDNTDFYNISKTPSFMPYIINTMNPMTGRQQTEIFDSSFLLNQAQMFESLMASTSQYIDTANTRFYNEINTGFSARPVSPGEGNLGYYTCIILNLSRDIKIVGQTFFVRLGIEKIITVS